MAKDITRTFIKRRHEVEDPDETVKHTLGGVERTPFDASQGNVFFIGPRGSGKSTLAREVAERLAMLCRDTDEMVAGTIGESISEYVQRRGWQSFRQLEQEQLREVCRHQGQVVATGGGIVLLPENRRLMKESGSVFYLMSDVETLLGRLQEGGSGTHRPPLYQEAGSLREEVSRVLQDREPLYFETLHFILQANKPVAELAGDVLTMLGAASR